MRSEALPGVLEPWKEPRATEDCRSPAALEGWSPEKSKLILEAMERGSRRNSVALEGVLEP
jgi:hypothetical protein